MISSNIFIIRIFIYFISYHTDLKKSIYFTLNFRNSEGYCLQKFCVTLPHMSIRTGVVVAVTFQQVDDTPDAETSAQSDNEGLKNGDSLIEKCHKL